MAGQEHFSDSRNVGVFGQFGAESALVLGSGAGLSRPSPHGNMYGEAGYAKLQQKSQQQVLGLKQLKKSGVEHAYMSHGGQAAAKNGKNVREYVQDDEEEVHFENYRPISRFARDHIEMVKDWSDKIEKLQGKALRGQRLSESFRNRLDRKLEHLTQRFCEAKDWFAEEFSQMLCDELSGESNLRKAVTNLLAFSLKEDTKPSKPVKNRSDELEPMMLGKRFVLDDKDDDLEVATNFKDKKDSWDTSKPIWKPKSSLNHHENFDYTSKEEKFGNSTQSLTIRIPDVSLDPLSPSKGARQLISKALEYSSRKDESADSIKGRNAVGNLISARKSSGPYPGKNTASTCVPLPEVPLEPPKPSLPLTSFEFTPAQSRLSANSPCSHLQSTTLGVPVKPTISDIATKSMIRDLFTKRIREYIVDGELASKILGETRCVLPYPKGMWTVILNDRIMAQFVPEAIRSREGQEIKPVLDIDPNKFSLTNPGLVISGEQQNIRSGTGGTTSVPTNQNSQLSSWVLTPPQLRLYDESQYNEFTISNGLLQMASLSRFLDQLFKIDGKYCLVKSDGGDLVYIGSSNKIFMIDIRVLDPATNQIIPELLLDLEGPELQDFDVISLPNGGFRVAYLASFEENILFVATIPPKPAPSSSESGSNCVSPSQQIAVSSPDNLSAPVQSGFGTEQMSSINASDSASKIELDPAAPSPLSVSQSIPLSGAVEGLSSEAKLDNPSPQPSVEVEIVPRPRWYKLEEAEFLDKDLNIGFSSEMSKDFTIKFRKVLFIDDSILAVGVARVNSKVERIQYMDNAFLKVSKSRIKFKKILSALCPMYRPNKADTKERGYQNVDVDVISVVKPTPFMRYDPSFKQATKNLGKSLSKLKFIQHLDLENNFRALFPVPDFSSCLESDSEHEYVIDIVESEVSVFWEDTPGLLEIAAIPTTGDIFITSEEGKFFLLTAGCPKQIQKDLALIQASAGPTRSSRTGTADKERKPQTGKMVGEPAKGQPLEECLLSASPVRTATQDQPVGMSSGN